MQPAAILFPDVELVFTDYLRTALAGRPEAYASGVFVSNAVPNPRRDRMVIVRRDGGPRTSTTLEAARVAVRVWASTDRDANDLARLVRALLWAMPDGDPVTAVRDLSGPSAVPDASGQPLRFLTVEAVVRGSDLT